MMQRPTLSGTKLYALPMGIALIDLIFHTTSLDPLNPAKLWALGLLAAWMFADLTSSHEFVDYLRNQLTFAFFISVLVGFTILNFVAFLRTSPKTIGLLGDTSRNLGFLNYLFLAIVITYVTLKISLKNIYVLLWTSISLLSIFSVYGIIQYFKVDFIKWSNPYNPIILTTGNPDFAATLLGLLTVICFGALFIKLPKKYQLYLFGLCMFSIIVIYMTHALQGLVGVSAGFGFILFMFALQRNKRIAFSLLATEIVVGVLSILGMLQIGPLAKYFFKSSVTDRGYDWRAALAMFKSHPFFGVGVDRYSDFFMQYREAKYPLLYGYSQGVNNAHNVFLQFFATSGVFVGVFYILLIVFVSWRAIVVLRKNSGTTQMVLTALIAGWVVYVAQSFISVDVLVNSIWGWVLAGAIVGCSMSSGTIQLGDATVNPGKSSYRGKVDITDKTKPQSVYRYFIFVLTLVPLLFVLVPMYRNEVNTEKFLRYSVPSEPAGQDLYKNIAKATFNQPLLNPNYKEQIAAKMAQNNFLGESIDFFKRTIKLDSRNGNSLSLLALVYENSNNPLEAIKVRRQLAVVDPYGANNLLALVSDYLKVGDSANATKVQDSILQMAPRTEIAKSALDLLKRKS
jgi:O-antigen ligase